MSKMGYAALTMSVIGAGVVGYVLMNKNTRNKAEKFINNTLDTANHQMKQMKNK